PYDPPEKRSTWLWSLAAALCFVALAVLLSGVGLRAYAAPTQEVDKKDAGKKDEPKKDDPKKDVIDPNKPLNPDEIEQLRKDIEKMQKQQMEELTKAMKKLQEATRARNPGGLVPPGGIGGGNAPIPVNPFRGLEDNFALPNDVHNPFGRTRHQDGRLGVLA